MSKIPASSESQSQRKETHSNYLDRAFSITGAFKRFDQKNDIFNRASWDDTIHPKDFFKAYDIANYKPKKSKGFDHWDFAFRNASWHLTDVVGERDFEKTGKVEGFTDYFSIQTGAPENKAPLKSSKDTTLKLKKVATLFGAGMVGVTHIDDRWIYSRGFNRKSEDSTSLDLPKSLKYVIVIILPQDYELSKTYPTALSGASTGLGYGSGLHCANTLAQFITNLGYEAIASLNDTGLNIPMAIQAGLGEYGRHGLLITPKYGPNVRIAKVFTDLPLEVDVPIEMGVRAFCNVCNKCADNCPPRAIPAGPPQSTPPNFSSLSHITKWTVNAEKCFKFWVGMNTDCAICIRVCPYNKDYTKWWNRLGIRLANSPLRSLMLRLDSLLKFDSRKSSIDWWNKS